MSKKLLACALLAACALAASAFASPPPATGSPGFAQSDVIKSVKDVSPVSLEKIAPTALAKDINPVSLVTADSGSGAASAFKAFEAKRAAQAPVQRVLSAADVGWHQRVLAGVGGGSGDVDHGGGSGCSPMRDAMALHERGEIPAPVPGAQT